jgi:hypothetical protein
MNRIKLTALLLGIGACALSVIARTSSASSEVDCSSVKDWSPDTHYNFGDHVVHTDVGAVTLRSLYMCRQQKCFGAGSSEPYKGDRGHDIWAWFGTCQ